MVKYLLILSALFFSINPAFAGPKIYANDGSYRGHMGSQYDPESINNPYGKYGSQYSAESIKNQYGQYGSQYSQKSFTNQYAQPGTVYVNGSVYQWGGNAGFPQLP